MVIQVCRSVPAMLIVIIYHSLDNAPNFGRLEASKSAGIQATLLLCSLEFAFLEANGYSIPGNKIVISPSTSSQATIQALIPGVPKYYRDALLEQILQLPFMDEEKDEELVINVLGL